MSPIVRSSKSIVFIAMMSALGNVLSAISIFVTPIIPSIPFGGMSISLALDLSHVTTFIAALFGGPVIGCLTGMIGGLIAAYQFGFSQGNLITTFGLPIGKALTGVTAGLIMRSYNILDRRILSIVLTTVSSYIPEGVFTAILFIYLFPLFFPLPLLSAAIIAVQIIVKAFFEMIVIGLIISGMIRNQGFTAYVKGFFT
jgi:riboflavin transporter FmnP